ncbi:MAG TPA: ABC transporter permease [Candidatus Omnitrophota bacterium]|nr:ABC transporter permease [Candidatus Omnitrophota bacterium]HPT07365.1 ABC transporter permease [Candidatus Omnitrophota bacterium]
MKVELFIAWRYLCTKRKEKFISLISLISVLGISIGVMALIVVLAVMTGFDRDLHEKMVGNYSDIIISADKPIGDTDENPDFENILRRIGPNAHVKGISPYIQGQILIREGNRFFAVGLRGVNPLTEPQVTKINQYLVRGSLAELGPSQVLIGRELASFLGARVGSDLTFFSPTGKQQSLKVAGIFASGMYDYDANLVLTTVKTAQEIYGMDGSYSAVAVKLDDMYLAKEIKKEIGANLGWNYYVKTWMEINPNFFAALKLEKLTMFVILTLIVLVASFNIISTLIVLVVDKTKDIGVLKALGMPASSVRKIFVLEGLAIGLLGIGFGVFGGVGLCVLLKKYQFIKLPQDVYYIDRLPVSIALWPDVALIVLAALMIALIATIYPAIKASRLHPVEALRYD